MRYYDRFYELKPLIFQELQTILGATKIYEDYVPNNNLNKLPLVVYNCDDLLVNRAIEHAVSVNFTLTIAIFATVKIDIERIGKLLVNTLDASIVENEHQEGLAEMFFTSQSEELTDNNIHCATLSFNVTIL